MVSACSSAGHSIGYSARSISYGDADVMVAGGAEAAISPLGMAGFNAAKALSTRNDSPEEASRPWDKGRDGFVLGEGAGVLILEELEAARKRSAKIYAEVAGFGQSDDAFHITAPAEDGIGAKFAMINALEDSNLNISEIGVKYLSYFFYERELFLYTLFLNFNYEFVSTLLLFS